MTPFVHELLPGRIVFGCGTAGAALVDELDRLDARRAVLVCTERERAVARSVAEPVQDRLVGLFDEVRMHVPVEVARDAVALARRTDADLLLAVGGGSTTGTAKAVALELGLPIVAIPTTYAGSEMTPVWGRTDARRKTTGRDTRVLPRTVIYDPELTVSLPPAITGPSGMNAMAHCVEALWAPAGTPLSAVTAEEGIRALASGVPRAVVDPADLSARADALWGACLAGAAFATTGSALHHKICHVLGGAFDLPHAETHTVLLPQVMAFYETDAADAARRVRRALDLPERTSAARALYELIERIGAPTALRDVGLGTDRVDEATDLVAELLPIAGPRPVDRNGLRDILARASAGERPD